MGDLLGFGFTKTGQATMKKSSVAGIAGAFSWLASGCGAVSTAQPASNSLQTLLSQPRIAIVSPMAMEQAPVLAAMAKPIRYQKDGYVFWLGTLNGVPVLSVRSGEKEYAAEMAATVTDTLFPIKAAILEGTAGSRNPYVHVGDVVVGAMVVDKSTIHYHNRGFQSPYSGVEMRTTAQSLISHARVGGSGAAGPTPKDAGTYGDGQGAHSPHYEYVESLAASAPLVALALKAPATSHGPVPESLFSGVIGSANQWTEPLAALAAQNALYQTDAGENEGMGFAFANAQLGVPWVIIRGISDSPWTPSVYHGVLAARRAAQASLYLIAHWPRQNLRPTATLSMLSLHANARMHGYLVADKAYYQFSQVTAVQYANASGHTVTTAPDTSEYTHAAAGR